jgi:hypothetical protein
MLEGDDETEEVLPPSHPGRNVIMTAHPTAAYMRVLTRIFYPVVPVNAFRKHITIV